MYLDSANRSKLRRNSSRNKTDLGAAMSVSTSKISTYLHDARPSKVDSEVHSVALFWIVSLLGTALLAYTVCVLDIVPAWD